MKPALKIPLFIISALAVIGGGLYLYQKSTTPTLEERYRLQAVEKGALIQTVSANGTLNPVVLVNVGIFLFASLWSGGQFVELDNLQSMGSQTWPSSS